MLWMFPVTLAAQPMLDVRIGQVLADNSPSPVLYATTRVSGSSPGIFRSADGGASWTAVYLSSPGRSQPSVEFLLFDPGNPLTIYAAAGTLEDGVWKSANGGASWSRIDSGLPSSGGVDAFALPPATPHILYLKTAAALYKSANGGQTWVQQSALPGSERHFSVNLGRPATMIYAGGRNIYRSTDEGASWQQAGAIDTGPSGTVSNSIYQILSDPGDAATLWATVRGPYSSYAGLYRSTNQGSNWEKLYEGEWARLTVDPAGRPNLYLTNLETGSVAKSVNRGGAWRHIDIADHFVGAPVLSVNAASPDVLYAALSDGCYRSADAGETWQRMAGSVRPTLEVPASIELRVERGGTGSYDWTVRALENVRWTIPFTLATSGETWLSVNVAGGTTPASIKVTINAADLPSGSYTGSLRAASSQASHETLTIPVRVEVVEPVRGPVFSSTVIAGSGVSGFAGDGGPADAARLSSPHSTFADAAGNIYIADESNHRVRRVSPDGRIATIAGTGEFGFSGDGGPAAEAKLWRPRGLARDSAGTLYVMDSFNDKVRKITPSGTISTLAGSVYGTGISLDATGVLYVAESSSNRVRRVAADGSASQFAAGTLSGPADVAVDAAGNVYIADTGNHRVRKVAVGGAVATVAGTGSSGFQGDGGAAAASMLSSPRGVAVDREGNVYIADTGNGRIRMVDTSGTIYTIASGLTTPTDVFASADGSLIVTESGKHRVHRLVRSSVPRPAVSPGGIVNAASFSTPMAPGSLVTIFGSNLALSTESASGAPWPQSLGGASVRVNGQAAPLYYASPGQLNAQLPVDLPAGESRAVVSVGGVASAEAAFSVAATAPGILVFGSNRAVAQNPDGKINTQEAPARSGEIVVLYLTGIGVVDNPAPTGAATPSAPLARPLAAYAAQIGDQPSEVAFLGLVPGLVGLAQANLVIPTLPPGDYPVVLSVGGVASNRPLLSVR